MIRGFSILFFIIFVFVSFAPVAVFADSHDSSMLERSLREVVDESSKQRFFYSIQKWRQDMSTNAPSMTSKIPAYAIVGIITVLIIALPWIVIHRRQPFHNDRRKIILRWVFVQSAYLVLALTAVVILHLMGYTPNLLDALTVSCMAVFVSVAVNLSYFLVNPEIG